MTLLHIALKEGFFNDNVTVTVNDSEAFRKSEVTTRLQIGLADTVELDLGQDFVKVEVFLANRNLSDSVSFELLSPVYLGVSVSMVNQIHFEVSSTPFGYV